MKTKTAPGWIMAIEKAEPYDPAVIGVRPAMEDRTDSKGG